MAIKAFCSIILAGFMPIVCLADSGQSHNINPDTKAETWETRAHGVTFSLTQILPEQARAFYVNRGFTLDQIEPYATSCIYMTVLRNDQAPGVIHYVLQDWSVVSGKDTRPPLKVSDWMKRLAGSAGATGATQSALIAFRWAQFPPEQEYEPGGDWNQGMLTTGLPAGSQFDAVARWEMNGKKYEGVLSNVRCAK